eukprot:570434-Pleurochrysis_carterae.AAC.1
MHGKLRCVSSGSEKSRGTPQVRFRSNVKSQTMPRAHSCISDWPIARGAGRIRLEPGGRSRIAARSVSVALSHASNFAVADGWRRSVAEEGQ